MGFQGGQVGIKFRDHDLNYQEFFQLIAKKVWIDGEEVLNFSSLDDGCLETDEGKTLTMELYDDVVNVPKEIKISYDNLWEIQRGSNFEGVVFNDPVYGQNTLRIYVYCSTMFEFAIVSENDSNDREHMIENPITKLCNLTNFVKRLIKEKRIPEISLNLTIQTNCCS